MRLIDADALIKYLKDYRWEFVRRDDFAKAIEMIDCAKTVDAVEVIRCRDCKHFAGAMAIGYCKRIPDKPIIPIPYDNYCGFAERRGP